MISLAPPHYTSLHSTSSLIAGLGPTARGAAACLTNTEPPVRVMGILNVTPDSFSDGGRWMVHDAAVAHALEMVEAGATIIDVGGESTRPGAEPVPVEAELERVIPVIEAIRAEVDVTVSVDTSKPQVMGEAVAAGAGLINDVYALRHEGAVEAAAKLQVPVCLMHMLGEPRTMQRDPRYTNVVEEVGDFLRARVSACAEAGVDPRRLLLDPGFGFGKTVEHNLVLLNRLEQIVELGHPVLAGGSRKSTLGVILGREACERVPGSVAMALIAMQKGAQILRVHDVAPTVDALVVARWSAREGQSMRPLS